MGDKIGDVAMELKAQSLTQVAGTASTDNGMLLQMMMMMENSRREDREQREKEFIERERMRALDREREREDQRQRDSATQQHQQMFTALLGGLLSQMTGTGSVQK